MAQVSCVRAEGGSEVGMDGRPLKGRILSWDFNDSDCCKMIRGSDRRCFKDRNLFEKKQAQPREMSFLSRKKWNAKDSSGFDVKNWSHLKASEIK